MTCSLTDPTLTELIEAALDHHGHGPGCGHGHSWSMGAFGAIAEFHHVAGDPPARRAPGLVLSDRGGLRLDDLTHIRPIAWEALSPRPDRWQQGVSLCLPADRAAMAARKVLTELGPDPAPLREADRGAVLFDMGLGLPQVDFCVRCADPALIAALRAECGRSVMDPASTAMALILPAHPHRVALTRIGRVEVFQKIGGPDTGGVSPIGPHTHVLPKLLRGGRTHSANTPIPAGLVPVAGLHPESPVMDALGADRDFDAAAHEVFQQMLCRWGDPQRLALKRQVAALLAQGQPPESLAEPGDRHARATLRVTLRQAARMGADADLIRLWRGHFDRDAAGADEDTPGH